MIPVKRKSHKFELSVYTGCSHSGVCLIPHLPWRRTNKYIHGSLHFFVSLSSQPALAPWCWWVKRKCHSDFFPSCTYLDAKVTCTPTFDMHNKAAVYNISKYTLSQNTSFFILLVRNIALVCGSFYYDSVIVLCRDINHKLNNNLLYNNSNIGC